MFCVYVIKNQNGKIYIGQTNNVGKRMDQHNDPKFIFFGKNAFTKTKKGNWNLVYYEKFKTRKEAKKREAELKSSRGRNFIHQQILGR